MTNRSKAKGTKFETACVRFLRKRLEDERIERRALHGNKDAGDIFGVFAHGHEGIVECKDYKQWAKVDLARWQEQTVIERGNADADFALLVVHKAGCGSAFFGDNHCYMQVRDLERIVGGEFRCLAGDSAKDTWLCMPLEVACTHIMGDYEMEEQ